MYRIEYAVSVADDLAKMRAFDRKRLLDRIEKELSHEPSRETKNKKPVPGLAPPWEHESDTWELRVGEYRAFYEVDDNGRIVGIRAIRRKPPHSTTEDIL